MGKVAIDRMLWMRWRHYGAGRDGGRRAVRRHPHLDPDHIPALHLSAVIAFVTDRAAEGAVLLEPECSASIRIMDPRSARSAMRSP